MTQEYKNGKEYYILVVKHGHSTLHEKTVEYHIEKVYTVTTKIPIPCSDKWYRTSKKVVHKNYVLKENETLEITYNHKWYQCKELNEILYIICQYKPIVKLKNHYQPKLYVLKYLGSK